MRLFTKSSSGFAALEYADDAGVRDAGADFVEAQCPQVLCNDAGGAKLAIRKFGVLVEVVTPGDDLGLDVGEGRFETGLRVLRMARRCENG